MKTIPKITIGYNSSPVFVRMFMVLLTSSEFMLDWFFYIYKDKVKNI